ncbi:MAG: EAL domain-containing protein [Proteobacteria bacterium]|nr:EAL domain-containing protein [Pseudomonadota bacterium]
MAEFKFSSDSMPMQEHLLLDYAQRMGHRRTRQHAVHVHLSQLRGYNRRPYHVRIAAKVFEDLIKLYDGQLFVLGNNDLVFIWRGDSFNEVKPAVETLRYLFRADPLAQDEAGAGPNGAFCTFYNLSTDYKAFLTKAVQLHELERKRALSGDSKRGRFGDEGMKQIRPVHLAKIEEVLARANLVGFMRWQPVCAIIAGAKPHPVFQELFVAIAELEKKLVPGFSLAADRWLFQQLTTSLDRRVMALLTSGAAPLRGNSISLNLNIATVNTDEFDRFARLLKEKWQGRVIIEIDQIDVIANVDQYTTARDRIHDLGYRLCLDGLSHLSLPFIDREKLKAELVKVRWEPTIVDGLGPDQRKDLEQVVHKAGRERVILSRCEAPDAITFGQSVGITLFQGHHVETLIDDTSRANVFLT